MVGTVTPKITQLWIDYFDNFEFDIIVAPTTAITARPIDASEPYSEINSRLEVGIPRAGAKARFPQVPGWCAAVGLAPSGSLAMLSPSPPAFTSHESAGVELWKHVKAGRLLR